MEAVLFDSEGVSTQNATNQKARAAVRMLSSAEAVR